MSQKHFWGGVAVGSGAIIGAVIASGLLKSNGDSRIVRIEKSMQIGSDVASVFAAWSHFERIPQYCRYITHVHNLGNDRSEWTANVDGRIFNWDAEVTRVIPNQVIGWKSVSGASHSGRITFAPIGHDTLVHVQMNYEPSMIARPVFAAIANRIELYVEKALRDFKSELESIDRESETVREFDREFDDSLLPSNVRVGKFGPKRDEQLVQGEATGTHGSSSQPNANPIYGSNSNSTVEFSRPTEKKNFRNE